MTMMAPEYYVFTGRDGEVIPDGVTHVLIAKARKFVPARAFQHNFSIEEVICHDGVIKIEAYAFENCPRLRRVIVPGVRVIGKWAFYNCWTLPYIECGKLEIIGEMAFGGCESLNSIILPSIKIVQRNAFTNCENLTNVEFGKELESIGEKAFYRCLSLERIPLPLKDGIITDDGIFQECKKLDHIDLLGGVYETIAALLMEEWRNDMNEEIGTISHILRNTPVGNFLDDPGGKAQAIRAWISTILLKIVDYKVEHRRYLNVAATSLQAALPNDIVLKNVLPFLELTSYTFEGEN